MEILDDAGGGSTQKLSGANVRHLNGGEILCYRRSFCKYINGVAQLALSRVPSWVNTVRGSNCLFEGTVEVFAPTQG